MTNQIYRLADERDITKEVYICDFNPVTLNEEPKKAFLVSFDISGYYCFDGKESSKAFHCRFAFIEVTSADFSIKELIPTVEKRGYAIVHREDSISIGFKPSVDLGKVKAEFHEKTLADFNDGEIRSECSKRKIYVMTQAYADEFPESIKITYNQGYEAGKKDAEPKWISIKEEMPPLHKLVFILKNNIPDLSSASDFEKWEIIPGLTHWAEIIYPKPPEQEKSELKYTCAQCGKEISPTYCGSILTITEHLKNYGTYFCDGICREDYEWVDAEWPRDRFKPCRVKDYGGWYNEILVWFNPNTKHFLTYGGSPDTEESYTEICQVRRDSVGNK